MQRKKPSDNKPKKTTDARSAVFQLPPRPNVRRPIVIGGVRCA